MFQAETSVYSKVTAQPMYSHSKIYGAKTLHLLAQNIYHYVQNYTILQKRVPTMRGCYYSASTV